MEVICQLNVGVCQECEGCHVQKVDETWLISDYR
jgi:hypothetical protein